MFKACARCGRIHPHDYKCTVGKKFDSERYNDETRRLRNTSAWQKKAQEIKEQANWLCEVCFDQGIYNYNQLETHHITKLSEDKELLLDNDNLICLCTYHHKMADKGLLDADYLRGLARRRGREDTPVGS